LKYPNFVTEIPTGCDDSLHSLLYYQLCSNKVTSIEQAILFSQILFLEFLSVQRVY